MKLRPRFSVRTLAILVTLVCAYFAAWEATHRSLPPGKRFIIESLDGEVLFSTDEPGKSGKGLIELDRSTRAPYVIIAASESPGPLLIIRNEVVNLRKAQPITEMRKRRYYLWLLGPRIKLPIEKSWTAT